MGYLWISLDIFLAKRHPSPEICQDIIFAKKDIPGCPDLSTSIGYPGISSVYVGISKYISGGQLSRSSLNFTMVEQAQI
jgi:hypothetical protein